MILHMAMVKVKKVSRTRKDKKAKEILKKYPKDAEGNEKVGVKLREVAERVLEGFGIQLEPEVRIW